MLDSRERAALQICRAVCSGAAHELPGRAAELDALPANLTVRLMVRAVALAARAEAVVPDVLPRAMRQLTAS